MVATSVAKLKCSAIESPGIWCEARVMADRISRIVLAVVACCGLFALTVPRPVAAHTEHAGMSCCAHQSPQPAKDHCPKQPQSTEEQQCCAACLVGLSLFLSPPPTLLFSPD